MARSKASIFIKKNLGKTFAEISSDDDLQIEAVSLWKIMHFYQRLLMLIQSKQIHTKEVPHLFGEVFTWRYLVAFQSQLESTKWQEEAKWDSIKDMKKLYDWMEENTPDKTKWEVWVNRQKEDLDRILQEIGRSLS